MTSEPPPPTTLSDLPAELISQIFQFLVPPHLPKDIVDTEEPERDPNFALHPTSFFLARRTATKRALVDIFNVIRTCLRCFEIGLPILYRATIPNLDPRSVQGLLSALETPRGQLYLDAVRSARLQIHGRLRTLGSQEYENRVIMELADEKRQRGAWIDAFGRNLKKLALDYVPVVHEVDDERTAEYPESVMKILERVGRKCVGLEALGIVGDGLYPGVGGDSLVFFACGIPAVANAAANAVAAKEGQVDKELLRRARIWTLAGQRTDEDSLSSCSSNSAAAQPPPRAPFTKLKRLHISRAALFSNPPIREIVQADAFAPNLTILSLGMRDPTYQHHSALASLYGDRIEELHVSYPNFKLRESERSPPWFSGYSDKLRRLHLERVILSPALVDDIAPLFLRAAYIGVQVDGNPSIRFGNSMTIRDAPGTVLAVVHGCRERLIDLEGPRGRTKLEVVVKDVDWFEMRELEALWGKAFADLSEAGGTGKLIIGRTVVPGLEFSVTLKEKSGPTKAASLMMEQEMGFVPRGAAEGRAVTFRAIIE